MQVVVIHRIGSRIHQLGLLVEKSQHRPGSFERNAFTAPERSFFEALVALTVSRVDVDGSLEKTDRLHGVSRRELELPEVIELDPIFRSGGEKLLERFPGEVLVS